MKSVKFTMEIIHLVTIRITKYAKQHLSFPDQVLYETYRFPLRGKGVSYVNTGANPRRRGRGGNTNFM